MGLPKAAQATAADPAPALPPTPARQVTLEQAIALALAFNPGLRAAAMTVPEAEADQITAAIRPNPVLTWDALFVPYFSPNHFNASTVNTISEFDALVAYTFERGGKRKRRMQAAQEVTAVTRSSVADLRRQLRFQVAQQFVGVLLAKSTLAFAQQDLASFDQTIQVSRARYQAGQISEGDYLKITLQRLQFQTDVSSARLALVQARAGLRAAVGYAALARNFQVIGQLAFVSLHGNADDYRALALKYRPDLRAAEQGVTAAQGQYLLAKANGKRDLTTTFGYTRLSGLNTGSLTFNMEIPIFDRNQGNIEYAAEAHVQARDQEQAARQQVLTDVVTAYEAAHTGAQVVRLYQSGYLKQALDSRNISSYAYTRGAASLLDFLDAERSYRDTELAYRQALGAYMLAREQLMETAGTRHLP
ncbi:MAG: TolC family protein [Terriglobales bacterium]